MKPNSEGPIIHMIHRIAAYPWAYDFIQVIFGQKNTFRRLTAKIPVFGKETVVEVGDCKRIH
jgi:hypothetical protein